MKTIVHRIRLLPGATHAQFESWVRGSDYATCPQLASLLDFHVCRVSDAPDAPFHYIEVIRVDSMEAFEADMKLPAFGKLVEAFSKMAEVVDEISGDLVEPGYRRTEKA
ncbi:MAG: hypothetical protein KC620_03060 [Myxococcales bacterium]|nr:hypothetical protein [Myxococcales bacterium]